MSEANECDRCGTVSESVQQTPHSIAEIGDPLNPYLCNKCDREVSR